METLSGGTCDHYQELASAFADNNLTAEEMALLQGHLRECGTCRQFLGGIYRVRDLLRVEEARRPLQAVHTDFASAVAKSVAKEKIFARKIPPGPPALSAWRRFSGAAAAAVLIVTAGWSWYSLSTPEETLSTVAAVSVSRDQEEGTVDSYLREHALQTMNTTFLGNSEGIELASFEPPGRRFE